MSSSNDATAAASSRRAAPPTWILLNEKAFIDDWQNASTAMALTSTGQPIRVTLVAAEPPNDSYFCVHCPGLEKKRNHEHIPEMLPFFLNSVIYSEGDLALLNFPVLPTGRTDYFIYKAGPRPSLRLLPATCSYTVNISSAAGLVPIGGDGEHFILAAVSSNRTEEDEEAYGQDEEEAYGQDEEAYELHVFRSDRGTWTATTLKLGVQHLRLAFTKAIALGGGELGWVDLRKCILVCDVLNTDDPKARLIPLPKLLPSNKKDKQRRNPREYRDVVVGADGSITCVEIEHCCRRVDLQDVSTAYVLHDSELPLGHYAEPPRLEYLGWRIITWYRAASSTCWLRRGLIHVDDILANDPGHTALLRPMAGDDGFLQGLTVRDLITLVPSLSIHCGDVVYIIGKTCWNDTTAWMLTVNMARRTLEEVVPISTGVASSPSFLSCSLSKYLEN